MTHAVFDVRSLKAALNKQASNQVSLHHKESFAQKIKRETRDAKLFTMSTIFNFYREGVLQDVIKKFHSEPEKSQWEKLRDKLSGREAEKRKKREFLFFYLPRISLVFTTGFCLYKFRPKTQVKTTASSNEEALRLQLMQLEIDKLRLELELARVK